VKHYWKRSTCFILLTILLAACGNVAIEAPHSIPPPSDCIPDDNPYNAPLEGKLQIIYDNWVDSSYDIGASSIYRQQAFGELVNYVNQWSDSVDIPIENFTVRISITYIHPELVQAVIVNHYLFRNDKSFKGKLDDQIKVHMKDIAARNEHIFFITFMAFDTESKTAVDAPIIINFPVRDLQLTNTSNVSIYKQHDDHHLENPINLNEGLEYGFIYYPMGVTQNGACQAVLDEKRDTRVVLRIPKVTINNADKFPRAWEYKYAPLIDIGTYSSAQNLASSEPPLIDQLTPYVPGQTPLVLEEPGFWNSLARLIWLETTLDP
jgi:hypothetical protein